MPLLPDALALPSGGSHACADQAAGLRRLMARRLHASPAAALALSPSPPLSSSPLLSFSSSRVALLAQHPALARWMHQHLSAVLGSGPQGLLSLVDLQDLPPEAGQSLGELDPSAAHLPAQANPVLLALQADGAALPQALTWAYARLKRVQRLDAALAPESASAPLLPRLHLVLVGVTGAAQGQQALANLQHAVQRHLGLDLPPGAWLCSAPVSESSANPAAATAALTLDFCRLAAELKQWRRVD